jgi:uncharacterized membrane protein
VAICYRSTGTSEKGNWDLVESHVQRFALMQHLLLLFLLVVAPIWDLYATPKLKRNPSSERKIRYYKTICTWLWIASALAVVAIGFRRCSPSALRPVKSPGYYCTLEFATW